MTTSGRLAGKVAVISGGASGIGRATALRFAAEGAKVAIADVSDDKGMDLAESMGREGHDVFFQHLDVTEPEAWADLMEKTVDRWGQLDILLNSAGVGWMTPLLETDLEGFRKVTGINLDGTFLGLQAAVRAMKKLGKGGSIINISSVLGLVGLSGLTAYGASKGGVKLLTKAAALECAELGLNIRVNSVHPGYIETPMVMRRFDKIDNPAEAHKHLTRQHPIGRLGQPEEIAAMVLYLASDESAFVTGAEFVIDGGYTAR
ncbi:MAG: glucose 1-dehydrogenase [Alphaproteobacteria bacterium]|nr:MAG: glucose 1-dehydrogenase [Alphaproteobacteria bacterium]